MGRYLSIKVRISEYATIENFKFVTCTFNFLL